jgi:Protein of unknown function (DUF2442)
MSYLPEVTRVKLVNGFVLDVSFDDGTEKYVDISQWFKGPVFRALRDPKIFAKFFVEGGTLAWPNGVDIAPEALYEAVDIRGRKEKSRNASRRIRRDSK